MSARRLPRRPRVRVVDRLVVLLVGLALVALGLLLVDWNLSDQVIALNRPLDTAAVRDVVDAEWWSWALLGGGLVALLLGLWWLLAHLPRRPASLLPLTAGDETSRLAVDLSSVADRVAARFADHAPVTSARATVRRWRDRIVLEVEADLDPLADVADEVTALQDAARVSSAEVARAFPDDPVDLRLLVDAPGRRPRGSRPRRGDAYEVAES